MPDDKPDLVAIYAIHDEAGAIRYVGKAVDPTNRFKQHRAQAKRRHTPLYCWLHGEMSAGRIHYLSILKWVDARDWQTWERKFIAEHRASGNLLNVADGGNEPKNAEAISPERARVAHIKRELTRAIKDPTLSGEAKLGLIGKMRLIAAKNPAMFGKWAAL